MSKAARSTHIIFQLTTSRRGRLPIAVPLNVGVFFQLTTSRRGRLAAAIKDEGYEVLSTHDLTQRSTYLLVRGYPGGDTFNSRPHAEVDRGIETRVVKCEAFNSRPHAEVDPPPGEKKGIPENFQLTTSRRGRRRHIPPIRKSKFFQLTTSRRGRRPAFRVHNIRNTLSTHDLTQRSTLSASYLPYALLLSTHDLTQRST